MLAEPIPFAAPSLNHSFLASEERTLTEGSYRNPYLGQTSLGEQHNLHYGVKILPGVGFHSSSCLDGSSRAILYTLIELEALRVRKGCFRSPVE
ncbi:hypothetical protein CRG98_013512 [Punica granatum]|uniref:Uncharacterized protein n=1 Tax=Punica granatum TaxID=22663 RepID=A0A2I0KC37_PUNGR|nr:hypothetical protein CRG98_013512 [Punica granatum]